MHNQKIRESIERRKFLRNEIDEIRNALNDLKV